VAAAAPAVSASVSSIAIAAASPVAMEEAVCEAGSECRGARSDEHADAFVPPSVGVLSSTAKHEISSPLEDMEEERRARRATEAQLHSCRVDSERELTLARANSFTEIAKANMKELDTQLLIAERSHRREMQHLQWEVERLEKEKFQRDELVRALEVRAKAAEEKSERARPSGQQCQAAGTRASILQERLQFVEAQLESKRSSEEKFALASKLAAEREEQLRGELSAADTRAVAAEASLAQTRRRELRLRRRQAPTASRHSSGRIAAAVCSRRVLAVESATSSVGSADAHQRPSGQALPSAIGVAAATASMGKLAAEGATAKRDDVWAEALSNLRALLAPTHDGAVRDAFVRLSARMEGWRPSPKGKGAGQVDEGADAGLAESLVQTVAWLVAFTSVALWRCMWVFAFRRLIGDGLLSIAQGLLSPLSGRRRDSCIGAADKADAAAGADDDYDDADDDTEPDLHGSVAMPPPPALEPAAPVAGPRANSEALNGGSASDGAEAGEAPTTASTPSPSPRLSGWGRSAGTGAAG